MPFQESPIVRTIIGCAIDVHRELGPGLLEFPYERGLAHLFDQRHVRYQRQLALRVNIGGAPVDGVCRVDFLVENAVILEVKSLAAILPVHEAQTRTYLKLSGVEHALLINFNVRLLKDGIRSFVRPG